MFLEPDWNYDKFAIVAIRGTNGVNDGAACSTPSCVFRARRIPRIQALFGEDWTREQILGC